MPPATIPIEAAVAAPKLSATFTEAYLAISGLAERIAALFAALDVDTTKPIRYLPVPSVLPIGTVSIRTPHTLLRRLVAVPEIVEACPSPPTVKPIEFEELR
jgi:hypothetical protein